MSPQAAAMYQQRLAAGASAGNGKNKNIDQCFNFCLGPPSPTGALPSSGAGLAAPVANPLTSFIRPQGAGLIPGAIPGAVGGFPNLPPQLLAQLAAHGAAPRPAGM